MNVFFGLLNGGQGEMARVVAQSSASALVAGLWQSALLVTAVALLLKVVPRTTAAVRFAIWTAVFCVSAAMPLGALLLGARAGGDSAAAVAHLQVDSRWSYLVVAIWALSVMARLVQLAVQGWRLRELWTRAVPVADAVLAGMECSDLLAERSVRVCTSEDVDRPSVIGFFAPRILIPAWLFTQVSSVELRHIVLHETEHLRRRDDWMNLLQKVGLVVFPLNPALLWVDRRLAAERELACDDGVLRRTQMPRAYAASLASIAEMRLERRMHRRVVALALGMLGATGISRRRSEFSRRIESILSRRAVFNPMVAGVVAAVLVVMVLGAGIGLSRTPQLVSFAPISGTGSVADTSGTVSASGLGEGARVRDVSFHIPDGRSALTARKPIAQNDRHAVVAMRVKSVPQRLKPRGEAVTYGTAEAVPLSETSLSAQREAGYAAGKVVKTKPVVREQWMVLTSFDEDAPARVVVRMGDGRFYVAPYAAVPVRDGWLIVQL